MNRTNDLAQRFPNASPSFLRLNGPAPAPQLERGTGPWPLAKGKVEEGHPGRFLVVVKSYRRRLLDEDNLCCKFVVDCCRYAGVLPADSPDRAHITVSQEKVGSKAEERSEILITPLP